MKLLVAILALLPALPATAQQKLGVFPLQKGTTWTYRARVKWTKPNNTVGQKSFLWTMRIEDFVDRGRVSAALFSGNPGDLAWYEPGREDNPGEWLLARIGDAYYFVYRDAAGKFEAIKAGKLDGLEQELADYIWFRAPLRPGDSACSPEQAESAPMYCWHVESEKGAVYQLAFRTLPDHTLMTLAAGKGITRWEYVHHGTVAEASVRLVEFHRGAGVSEKPFASNKKNQ